MSEQSEEIFMQNLLRFRTYAHSKGAYVGHGWIIFKGKVLTGADSEYLALSEVPSQRLLTDEEIRSAWENLVSCVRVLG